MEARKDVPLAPRTTLGVGGCADALVEVAGSAREVQDALAIADEEHDGLCTLLGSGSNVVVSDEGLRGVTLVLRGGGIREARATDDGTVLVEVDGGMEWDAFVAWAVGAELAGVELMSGIPGTVGAAPVQNVGAYGQALDDVFVSLEAVDRTTGESVSLSRDDCGFGYRTSRFKGQWRGRFVITSVTMRLSQRGRSPLSYRDLERHFADRGGDAESLRERRAAVLAVRGAKSMVVDPSDPLSRSAGSFFVSPVLPRAEAVDLVERVRGSEAAERLLSWYSGGRTDGSGGLKVPAAIVLLAAGFANGDRWGEVGLSPRHVLAIVNHGAATAQQVADVAAHVQEAARRETGVTLDVEPRFLGAFRPFDEEAFRASVQFVPGSAGTPAWARDTAP